MKPFELKPCPLCGGAAAWEYTPWNEDDRTGDDGTGWIECQRCHLTLEGYDRDEAERRWNVRGYVAAVEAERDALRHVLDGFSGPPPTLLQWKMICGRAKEVASAIDRARA